MFRRCRGGAAPAGGRPEVQNPSGPIVGEEAVGVAIVSSRRPGQSRWQDEGGVGEQEAGRGHPDQRGTTERGWPWENMEELGKGYQEDIPVLDKKSVQL